MDLFAEESSDEEYVPASEDPHSAEDDYDEEMETDGDNDRDEEEYEEDYNPGDGVYTEEDVDGAEIERLLREVNPGLLQQIQILLQREPSILGLTPPPS